MEIAQSTEAAAMQRGYEEGLEQARAQIEAAMEDANAKVRRALAALSAAIESFDQRQTLAVADVEDAIVAGAFGIAQAIVQRELQVTEAPGAEALARAMQLVPERGDITARMNPNDIDTLSIEDLATGTRTVRVVADASVEAGGCIVEVGETRIDSQLSSAFAHVQTALFGADLPQPQIELVKVEFMAQPKRVRKSKDPASASETKTDRK
jgi:flagellar assembly protein FliH